MIYDLSIPSSVLLHLLLQQPAMAVSTLISIPKLPLLPKSNKTQFLLSSKQRSLFSSPIESCSSQNLKNAATVLGVTGIALATLMVEPAAASASEIAIMGSFSQFNEPSNALSLPTWAIHVSSVVEWYLFTLQYTINSKFLSLLFQFI